MPGVRRMVRDVPVVHCIEPAEHVLPEVHRTVRVVLLVHCIVRVVHCIVQAVREVHRIVRVVRVLRAGCVLRVVVRAEVWRIPDFVWPVSLRMSPLERQPRY